MDEPEPAVETLKKQQIEEVSAGYSIVTYTDRSIGSASSLLAVHQGHGPCRTFCRLPVTDDRVSSPIWAHCRWIEFTRC